MRSIAKIAVCFGIVLWSSGALAFGSQPCSTENTRNWPSGTLNIGEVIPVNGVVTFTYNNGIISGQIGSFTVNPANLGPFSTTVRGVYSGAPACIGLVSTNIPVTGFIGDSGFVRGKYQVTSVYYAPPGSRSNVVYGSSFAAGTTTSLSNSFNVATAVSVATSSLFGDAGGVTTTAGWSSGSTSSSSTALTTTAGENLTIPGPASSKNGIDHTQDIIWIWLNPSIKVTVFPGTAVPIRISAVAWDGTDPDEMDVYPISVADLQSLAAGVVPVNIDITRLNRGWSATGALTTADYTSILAADPFVANPQLDPSADGTHRFDAVGQTINYTPAGSGAQPIVTAYTSSYQTTTTAGMTATDSHSVGLSFSGTIPWSEFVQSKLSITTTWTWANTWGSLLTNTSTQSANFSITSPLLTDGYTGPTAITVWKDNVYGTFMFHGAL
jgi:hypothetical protein